MKINLFRWREARQRQNIRNLIIVVAASLLLSLILCLMKRTSLVETVKEKRGVLLELTRQTNKLNSKNKNAPTNALYKKISRAITKSNQFSKNHGALFSLIKLITFSFPQDAYLEGLLVHGMKLSIHGHTKQYASAQAFLYRLKQSGLAAHVRIDFSHPEKTKKGGDQDSLFHITLSLRKPHEILTIR